ncbi:3-oxoacid CoA-transferase subunit A [Thermodesulfobacteriota bacterium]
MAIEKIYKIDEAVADIPDGATIMIGGFGHAIDKPQNLIKALLKRGCKDLTIISNAAGVAGRLGIGSLGGVPFVDEEILIENGQVKKILCSVPGSLVMSKPNAFEKLYNEGKIDLEYVPQGTLAERIRAGGAGIGAFYTPTGAVPSDEADQKAYMLGASGLPFSDLPGLSYFDHVTSFGMIRGGHIDITVLGALQVSEKGNLANWTFPKRGVGNIGGGMDLAFGCNQVIVTMNHVTPKGDLKILNECSYPLTAPCCVTLIVTDIAVIAVDPEGLVLTEFAPGWSVEEIQELTEPKLIVADNFKEIEL